MRKQGEPILPRGGKIPSLSPKLVRLTAFWKHSSHFSFLCSREGWAPRMVAIHLGGLHIQQVGREGHESQADLPSLYGMANRESEKFLFLSCPTSLNRVCPCLQCSPYAFWAWWGKERMEQLAEPASSFSSLTFSSTLWLSKHYQSDQISPSPSSSFELSLVERNRGKEMRKGA